MTIDNILSKVEEILSGCFNTHKQEFNRIWSYHERVAHDKAMAILQAREVWEAIDCGVIYATNCFPGLLMAREEIPVFKYPVFPVNLEKLLQIVSSFLKSKPMSEWANVLRTVNINGGYIENICRDAARGVLEVLDAHSSDEILEEWEEQSGYFGQDISIHGDIRRTYPDGSIAILKNVFLRDGNEDDED